MPRFGGRRASAFTVYPPRLGLGLRLAFTVHRLPSTVLPSTVYRPPPTLLPLPSYPLTLLPSYPLTLYPLTLYPPRVALPSRHFRDLDVLFGRE